MLPLIRSRPSAWPFDGLQAAVACEIAADEVRATAKAAIGP